MLCSKCQTNKPETEFCINNANPSGLDYFCKDCKKILKQDFYRTKRGVIVTIYDSQKSSSKRRHHPVPSYSLNQLYEWVSNQEIFHTLYDIWVETNYNKMDKPSIDRLEDDKPYTFENIQIVSYEENHAKATYNREQGITTQGSVCKPVRQYTLTGAFIQEFVSASQATKFLPDLKLNRQNIQKVCNGERKSCGGFIWKFKD